MKLQTLIETTLAKIADQTNNYNLRTKQGIFTVMEDPRLTVFWRQTWPTSPKMISMDVEVKFDDGTPLLEFVYHHVF